MFVVVFGTNGEVLVSRKWHVSQLELPIRRGKGANGNISVTWAVTTNDTGYSDRLIWPSNGAIDMASSQWNSSVVLNVANSETKTPEQALWITLQVIILLSEDFHTALLRPGPYVCGWFFLCGFVFRLRAIGS